MASDGPKGVSLEFLMDWSVEYPHYTSLEVCEKVKRKTKNDVTSASYLDLLEQASPEHVGPATFFLCHYWQNNFHNTITAINHYFSDDPQVKPESTFIWIDILCVDQHKYDENDAFSRIMYTKDIINQIKRTIFAFPQWDGESQEDTLVAFTRSWCIWELFCTHPDHLIVAMTFKHARVFTKDLQRQPDLVVKMFSKTNLSCGTSTATLPQDQAVLLEQFKENGGFERINQIIQSHMYRFVAESAWNQVVEMQRGVEREFDPASTAKRKSTSSNQTKRKSLRNLLRTQAFFLCSVTDAFKNVNACQYGVELYLGILREHERYRGNIDYEKIIAINFSNLADLYSEAKEYQLAVKYYRDALEINKKYEPTLIPDTLNGIANNLWQQGEKQEAETLFKQIIRLDRQTLGKEPTARAKRCLMNSLLNMGHHLEATDLDRAIPYIEEATSIGTGLYNDDMSEDTLAELRGLAMIYQYRRNQFAKAAAKYQVLLKLQDIITIGEQNEVLVEYDDDDILEGQHQQVASDLRNYAKCILMGQSKDGELLEPNQTLDIAAQCCRAALDLDFKHLGSKHKFVLKDLILMGRIEKARGNTDRVTALDAKIEQLGSALSRGKMRGGPLCELETKHFNKLEKQVANALESSDLSPRQYMEISSDLEDLARFHHRQGNMLKSIPFLCESTRLKMKLLGSAGLDGNVLAQAVRTNLVRLFQFFSVCPKEPSLVKHCATFVKMVEIFYRSEKQSDNFILALSQYGMLLFHVDQLEAATKVFDQALLLADQIYQGTPSLQWIKILDNAYKVQKAISTRTEDTDFDKGIELKSKQLELQLNLEEEVNGDEIAASMYELATLQSAKATDLFQLVVAERGDGFALDNDDDDVDTDNEDEAKNEIRDLYNSAKSLLQRGIEILEQLDEGQHGSNIVIFLRELAQVNILQDKYIDAEQILRKLVELQEDESGDEFSSEEFERDKQTLELVSRKIASLPPKKKRSKKSLEKRSSSKKREGTISKKFSSSSKTFEKVMGKRLSSSKTSEPIIDSETATDVPPEKTVTTNGGEANTKPKEPHLNEPPVDPTQVDPTQVNLSEPEPSAPPELPPATSQAPPPQKSCCTIT